MWPLLSLSRFFLAMVVAATHLEWFASDSKLALFPAKFSALVAVIAFLFISGYSICASLEREQGGFFRRRVLRIVPLYVFTLLAASLLPYWFGGQIGLGDSIAVTPSVSQVIGNLLFLQGFVAYPVEVNVIVWTLSIEVFFYLLAPMLLKVRVRVLVGAIVFSGIAYSVYPRFNATYFSHLLFGQGVLLLGWAWLGGFLVRRAKQDDITVMVALCGFCFITVKGDSAWLWPIAWAMPFFALYLSRRLQISRGVERLFLRLGDLSYPLYLSHLPAFYLFSELGWFGSGMVYLLSACAVAAWLDFGFDRPVKAALKRIPKLTAVGLKVA